jgi:hypothetical protein
VQNLGQRHWRPLHGAVQDPFQPGAAFREVPAALPEVPQGASQTQCGDAIREIDRPVQRRAQVVVLDLQQVQPGIRLRLLQLLCRLLGNVEEVLPVPVSDGARFSSLIQTVEPILANGLQHLEAHLATRIVYGLHQAVFDELGEEIEGVGCRGSGVGGRKGVGKPAGFLFLPITRVF